jgi:hypothetical protein
MQTATSDIRTDIVVKCPATGEVVGRVAVTSAAEVEAVQGKEARAFHSRAASGSGMPHNIRYVN